MSEVESCAAQHSLLFLGSEQAGQSFDVAYSVFRIR